MEPQTTKTISDQNRRLMRNTLPPPGCRQGEPQQKYEKNHQGIGHQQTNNWVYCQGLEL